MSLTTCNDVSGKHELVYDDRPTTKKRYTLDGVVVPGVSTFIKGGMPTSDGLVNWKIIKAVEFAVDNARKMPREALIAQAKTAYKKDSEEAAGIGNIVHEYAHLTSLGKNEEAMEVLRKHEGSPQWQQILNAVSKVDQFHEKHRGDVVLAEAMCASVLHQFAGRFDVLVQDGKDLVMRDYKTSKRFYVDQLMQCAAYAIAVREWYGKDVTALEVVRFSKDDGDVDVLRVDDEFEIDTYKNMALLALDIFNFNRDVAKDKRFK